MMFRTLRRSWGPSKFRIDWRKSPGSWPAGERRCLLAKLLNFYIFRLHEIFFCKLMYYVVEF
jgi:hypothetical protein